MVPRGRLAPQISLTWQQWGEHWLGEIPMPGSSKSKLQVNDEPDAT
jgi:hypothetical protein